MINRFSGFSVGQIIVALVIVCLLSGVSGNEANSAVISIPNDAPTIENAIEIANSGDTIIVYSEEVNWLASSKAGGVHISNKDLIIMGADPYNPVRINTEQSVGLFNTYLETSPLPPSPDTSMLLLEESDLVLMNLRLDKPLWVLQPVPSGVIVYDSPLHVVSGNLRMENCVWAGTINVRGNLSLIQTKLNGHSWMFDSRNDINTNTYSPSIYLHNSVNVRVEIVQTTIDCIQREGYQAIVLENLMNADIRVIDSQVQAGKLDHSIRRLGIQIAPEAGGAGISVRNCENMSLHLDGSEIRGGTGTHPNEFWLRPNQNPDGFYRGGPGGDGLIISNSTVKLMDGALIGGNGMNSRHISEDRGPKIWDISAGNGGNGLRLISSTVHYSDFQAVAGVSGINSTDVLLNPENLVPGVDGHAILLDEASRLIPLSGVASWEMYE